MKIYCTPWYYTHSALQSNAPAETVGEKVNLFVYVYMSKCMRVYEGKVTSVVYMNGRSPNTTVTLLQYR